tara:strand:- start:2494 stop:2748 length:255 start_codon:yes stop_codon:yes gene_type:complete
MINFAIAISLFFILFLIYRINSQSYGWKKKKDISILQWMNLSRDKRKEIFFFEKERSMKKKKALIKKIRDEYIYLCSSKNLDEK